MPRRSGLLLCPGGWTLIMPRQGKTPPLYLGRRMDSTLLCPGGVDSYYAQEEWTLIVPRRIRLLPCPGRVRLHPPVPRRSGLLLCPGGVDSYYAQEDKTLILLGTMEGGLLLCPMEGGLLLCIGGVDSYCAQEDGLLLCPGGWTLIMPRRVDSYYAQEEWTLLGTMPRRVDSYCAQ